MVEAGSGSGSSSTALHMCHCGKSFVRKEHLTRHQGTHSKLSYICNVCQRQFGRKDVLRRHSLLHQANHTRVVVSCDACRANKTKCSGGAQCSLCARRGIACTFQNNLRRSKRAATNDAPPAGNSCVGENENNHSVESLVPASPRAEALLSGESLCTEEEHNLPDHALFLKLKIVPSLPVASGELRSPAPGMEAIYEFLVSEKSSLKGIIQESDEFQDWVAKCLEAYLNNFHLRWPLLNAPSFDLVSAPLHLAASVFVIGTWLRNDTEWTERFCALQVHDLLLQYLLHVLIDSESVPDGQAWPIELFQAALLTLVFSLYCTDKGALYRAMLLRSVFITRLRAIGAFNTQLLNRHLETHFSSTYAPYTFSIREKFNRLLGLTYQFDVYFALAHEQPPMLHRQEVGAGIPASFALWNAHGLDIFAKRQLEEPRGRAGFLISEMTICPGSFAASPHLVEDVQLGLCGLFQGIWVLTQPLQSNKKKYSGEHVQGVLLIKTLDAWKYELDRIRKLAETRKITGDAGRYLLMAYRAEGTSVLASLERISTLIQDGMVLYYYLKMYHYAGIHASGLAGMAKRTEDTNSQTWRTSKYGREALICGLQMLKMVDTIRAPAASINPLTRYALAMALNVTRALVSYQTCECSTNGSQNPTMDHQEWTEIGGPINIDGMPVCVCKLKFWTQKFENAIQDQTIR